MQSMIDTKSLTIKHLWNLPSSGKEMDFPFISLMHHLQAVWISGQSIVGVFLVEAGLKLFSKSRNKTENILLR